MATVNMGYIINKIIKYLYRPALKNCNISRLAKVGSGSNLINVSMGKYSYCGSRNSFDNVSIGNYCSIASNCAIGGGEHPLLYVSTSPVFYAGRNIFGKNISVNTIAETKRVLIGNDVWIGEGVFISAGIRIGNGAVIGAHSVVTKDVDSYAIVAGAPAKLLRYRFDEKTIERLERSEWWEFDENTLSKYDFTNVDKFLEQTQDGRR